MLSTEIVFNTVTMAGLLTGVSESPLNVNPAGVDLINFRLYAFEVNV